MATQRAAYDTSRRTFRGRGGPTDGGLPKYNAARRQPNKVGGDDHDAGTAIKKKKYPQSATTNGTTTIAMESEQHERNESINAKPETVSGVDESRNAETKPSAAEFEIRHLLKRIRNVRESIQLSKTAIASPNTWQHNVLNPVGNCVHEWRSILRHHYDGSRQSTEDAPSDLQQEVVVVIAKEDGCEDIDMERTKVAALEVYMLVQLAMQSGPLAGAQPGYFKRCGSHVARQASRFLEDLEAVQELRWTEKQVAAVATWKTNAERAVAADKPMSKSVLKKRDKADKGNRKKSERTK